MKYADALLTILLLLSPMAQARDAKPPGALVSYVVADSYLYPKLTIEMGSAEYPVRSQDDSPMFQKAIDAVHAAGGGHVVVPPSEYRIMDIQMRSDVHVICKNGVIFHPSGRAGKNKGVSVFNFGMEDAITNASLIGGEAGTVFDFTGMTRDLRAVTVGECDNFRVANLAINDNQTKFSSITLTWIGARDGVAQSARNGLIENITANNAHYGYGAIQAYSGENLTFRNIKSGGGVAVRLETGLIRMNRAQIGGLFNILVEGAVSTNGQAALMLQPHTMKEGAVVARNISSDGSEFAVLIEKGFVSKERYGSQSELTPGSFKSVTIDGVNAVYRDGPIVTRYVHFKYYPKELHPQIHPGSGKEDSALGPSIAAVANMADARTEVSITNVTAKGFKYRPDIMTSADLLEGSLKDLGHRSAQSSTHN